MAKFYITTTIPYVNGAPHLGHALEFVQADALARYHRLLSGDENVYLLTGTDENAIKNVQAAEAAGVPVREFVDRNSAVFKKLLDSLNVKYDGFIRTTEDRHMRAAQAFWKAVKPEDIEKRAYRGLYCVGCEMFYKKEELNERGECHDHPGRIVEEVEEENYFFKLKNYQGFLEDLIKNGQLGIIPQKRKNELLSLIASGLEDFSISRPKERSKGWGIPVPGDESQNMYVWYDALVNYVSALGYPDTNADLYQKFWADNDNKIHVLGKGVSRFHAIYWPAMLKSVGLPLPSLELIHGYITVDGQKMGKSTGNAIDPFEIIAKYGTDALRFYLLKEIGTFEDGDFTWERFKDSYNAHLANGLGNFVARVLTLAGHIDSNVNSFASNAKIDKEIDQKIETVKKIVEKKTEEFKFQEALQVVWEFISFGDSYLNEKKAWTGDWQAVFNLTVILNNIATILTPFLPDAAEKILKRIIWEENLLHIQKGEPLFPRIS